MKGHFLRLAVIIGVAGLFAGGCARTRPAEFYTLSSLDVSKVEKRTEKAGQGVAVGIGPVNFPDYLERPQIVTRNSGNALTFAQFHRWAGSLREDFFRVFAENLSILIPTDRIFLFPWKRSTPVDYQVTADVIRFEGEMGDHVTLKARWTLLEGSGKKILLMKKSTLTEPVRGDDYEALVSAQSRALAGLSREIVGAIHNIFREK